MIYLELIWSFIQIGLFSIGGGYAAMPLIQHQACEVHNWLSMEEFGDILTISEMTPGPITINSATFVGIQVAGIPGAICATIGCIIPSSIIVTILAFIYYRFKGLNSVQSVLNGLRPAVIAMIATAWISIMGMAFFPEGAKQINLVSITLFLLAFITLKKWKINPIFVMLASGLINLLIGVI